MALAAKKNLQTELEKNNDTIMELDTVLSQLNRKRQEDLDQSLALTVQLDKNRHVIEMKEKECNQIMKDSEEAQLTYRNEVEKRLISDGKLKQLSLVVFFYRRSLIIVD